MKILISACLLGLPCRYDGRAKPWPGAEELKKRHTLIPFCPECYGGLPTPRAPSEIRGSRVISRTGCDVTDAYRRGAEEALAMCRMFACRSAVLKEKSPSCGCGKIYDGTFTGTLTDGDGITAALLKENGIRVYGESDVSALTDGMPAVPFTKMHGIGNDYIYVDQIRGDPVPDMGALALQMSERRFSAGADGVIYICRPDDPVNHGRMRMFNADGSEGNMCGNGIRCVGKFLYDNGYVPADCGEVRVETRSGVKTLRLLTENGACVGAAVEMGQAVFAPEKIPVLLPGEKIVCHPLEAGGRVWTFTAVSMGNPHAVIFTEDVQSLDLAAIGPALENHPLFPDRVNTEFVRVTDESHLEMRVWERGSGETYACGTGACAAVAAAILNGHCTWDRPVEVRLRGGCLRITVTKDWHVTMEGPAQTVYDGVWQLR